MYEETIDKFTNGFRELAEDLPWEALFWKPDSSSWSIAENMEHLILINQFYYPDIQALLSGNQQLPFTARIGFLVDFLGKSLLELYSPTERRRPKLFPSGNPR